MKFIPDKMLKANAFWLSTYNHSNKDKINIDFAYFYF
jgi:hypothetical protein